MNSTTLKIFMYGFPFIMWFVILFDPTALALGSTLLSLPPFLLGTAELIGNMIWILGLVLLIISILLSFLLIMSEIFEDLIKDTIAATEKRGEVVSKFTLVDKDGNKFFKERTLIHKIFNAINIVFSFIAIGSGFWFTGTIWLSAIIISLIYRKVGLELIDKYLVIYFKKVEEELKNE